MKRSHHSGLINSSHTLFFIGFTFFWAHVYSGYFPEGLRRQAFVLAALFALMLFVFKFLIDQFYDGVTILRLIVLYFCLSALMTFASALKGPIAEGQIPAIQLLFFGPYIYASAHPSLIMASVFPFYGAVTLVSSIVSSAILELVYNQLQPLIHQTLRSKLRHVDAIVDKTSIDTSDEFFLEDDRKGLAAAVLLLLGYGLAYSLLLIF